METLIKVIVLCYLAYQALEDIKNKSVSLKSIIIFSFASAVTSICISKLSLLNMLCGVAVGIGVVLIGKLMKDGIGSGDGAVLSSIGLLIGGKMCLLIFIIAITISAGVAIVLLVFKKVKMKQELPFIPYLLCAYVWTLC